jgi:hypothetical protein
VSDKEYTPRELAILRGEVTDLSDEEIDWYDRHGSDVIPGDDGLRPSARAAVTPPEPPPSAEFEKLSKTPPQEFVPPTFVSESARALEEKEK